MFFPTQITARVYRYRIESNLLDPAGGTVSEDRRYSTVSAGNFRYYEVKLSTRSASVVVDVELHSGDVGLYTSFRKLPTRDPVIGYSALYPTGLVGWKGNGPRTLSFTVPLAKVSTDKSSVFLGVYGIHADSAYKMTVTETTLQGSGTLNTWTYDTSYGSAKTVNLVQDKYYHIALQTAQADTAMVVGKHVAGSESVTANTWDKYNGDLSDTDLTVTATVSANNVELYASSTEVYASAERGYSSTNTPTGGSPNTLAVSLEHLTFRENVVYLSMKSPTAQSVTLTLTKVDLHSAISANTATVKSTCAALNSCSAHGSCIAASASPVAAATDVCHCHKGWVGADCSVKRNAGMVALVGTPDVVIPTIWPGSLSPFGVDTSFPAPFEVRSAPAYSRVALFIDGKAYPGNRSNIVNFGSKGTAKDGSDTFFNILVYSLQAELKPEVTHTFVVNLISDDGLLLDVDTRTFKVKAVVDCSHGISHSHSATVIALQSHYCVCHDGWMGVDCSTPDPTEGSSCLNGVCTTSYTPTPTGFKPYGGLMATQELERKQARAGALQKNKNLRTLGGVKVAREKATALAAKTKNEKTVLTTAASVTTEVATAAALLVTSKEAVHRKLEKNAVATKQARLEAARLQTANRELHIAAQRSLAEGQEAMAARLLADKDAAAALIAAKNAALLERRKKNRFKRLRAGENAKMPRLKADDDAAAVAAAAVAIA